MGCEKEHAEIYVCRHAGRMQVRAYSLLLIRLLPPSRAHSHLIILLLCPKFFVLALFDKHATLWGGTVGRYKGMDTQNWVQRRTRSREKREDCNIKEMRGQRVGNAFGGNVCVGTDAGEETHTIAAALVDGQQVVQINVQTVRRNLYQHMKHNTTKVSSSYCWAWSKKIGQQTASIDLWKEAEHLQIF